MDIFDFNHISPDLTIDHKLELKVITRTVIKNVFFTKKPFNIIKKLN